MKPKNKSSSSFFGAKFVKDLVPRDLPLLQIKEQIDWNPIRLILLTDSNNEPIIYSTTGRPAWDPLIIFKMLFLQIYHPASDKKVEERALTDLSYRLFLDIPFPSPVPDGTTLVRYRKKWGEEKIQQILKEINKQIQNSGLLQIKSGVVGDTTHQFANIQKPTARVLLLRVFKSFLREWNDFNQLYLSGKLKNMVNDVILAFDVFMATEDSNRKLLKTNRKERFANVVNHITGVLDKFYEFHQHNYSLIGNIDEWKLVFDKYNLLRKIISENTEIKDTDVVQTKGNRKIISDVDVDARSGQKTKTKKFTGYKIATVRSKTGFTLGVQTIPGDVPDMNLAPELIKNVIQDYDQVPGQAVFDKGFDSIKNRLDMHSLGVQPGIEFRQMGNSRNKGLFTNTNFSLNLEILQVTCPAGETSSQYSLLHNPERYLFKFSKDQCLKCSLYNQCTTNKTGRTIQFSVFKDLIDKDKEYLNTDEYETMRKTRWGQEADYGICKRTHGLSKTRYHGIKSVSLTNCMVFLVHNVKRFVKQISSAENIRGTRGHSVS